MNAPADPGPVFRREGDSWQALPQAQGPFGGMHGGAVAALCVHRYQPGLSARARNGSG